MRGKTVANNDDGRLEPLEGPDSYPPLTETSREGSGACATGSELLGHTIGPYKLLSILGEGGFGVVYLAEQKRPIRRRVALKVIKPGMDSKQVIARFEAERQALALLDHPHIAHVFDAGTTEQGRPYFVMEYIEGMPITQHCDYYRLTIKQRLQLFTDVCEAVQFAHQKGIIHRDIKPSNILVTQHEDKSTPMIIDFGVAKAVNQPLTEQTLYTEQGHFIGTPEYMSPEQAEMSTGKIDIRSDIYSLGVVLYELLTGSLPFDTNTLREGGIVNIRRIICEEDPKTPSTRLSGLGDNACKIAESRRTGVRALARSLRKELEWIPMKAMRKEAERRYRTAVELADDVNNYLNGRPLIAGPETVVYRAKKFAESHGALLSSVASLVIILYIALNMTTKYNAKLAILKENNAEQKEIYVKQNTAYQSAAYEINVLLARKYYENEQIELVRHKLGLCPTTLRHLEWHCLFHLSRRDKYYLRGHRENIGYDGRRERICAAFSNDGKWLVSGDDGNVLKIWDVELGIEVQTIVTRHKSGISSVVFGPDGKFLVSCDRQGAIKMWKVANWKLMWTVRHPRENNHPGPVKDVTVRYSKETGNIVSSSTKSFSLVVWDPLHGTMVKKILLPEYFIGIMSLDADRIVTCNGRDSLNVYDINSGEEIVAIVGEELHVESLAISPDARRIISVDWNYRLPSVLKIWDGESGKEINTLHGHQDIRDVAISPDGEQFISIGKNPLLKVCDINTGEEVATIEEPHASVGRRVGFAPDGHKIYYVYARDIVIKKIISDDRIGTLYKQKYPVQSVAFGPHAKLVVSGSRDDKLRIWDVGSSELTMDCHLDNNGVCSAVFTQDGKRVVAGCVDGAIKVVEIDTGEVVMTLSGHKGMVHSVAISPDGKRIISGGEDGMLKIWNAYSGEEMSTLTHHQGPVQTVAFSPDGKLIASGFWSLDGRSLFTIWDAQNGREVHTRVSASKYIGIYSVVFSSDNKLVVSMGHAIKVINVDADVVVMTLSGHKGIVRSIAISPDGKRIVSGSEDGVLKIWDSGNGQEVMSLLGHEGTISSVAISSDGKRIISGGHDGNIKIW
ncbi:protein kinase [Planctomycetota bacterium]